MAIKLKRRHMRVGYGIQKNGEIVVFKTKKGQRLYKKNHGGKRLSKQLYPMFVARRLR